MSDPVIILGLGFTTQRLARRLRKRGVTVYAAVRQPERFAELAELGVLFCVPPPETSVLIHSVPPLAEPDSSAIRTLILDIAPRRILYISSTGVYGSQTAVSAASTAAPNDDKGRARLDDEEWIAATGTPSLILRSAAIYGPGRGIHVRLREGRLRKQTPPRMPDGIVSRIHVDDLVAILEAGIEAQLVGAWPVADDQPAASADVAAWCAKLMDLSLPEGQSDLAAGRSVDGREIRELLGVKLKYSSYRTGIPASLAEETQ